MQKVRSTLTTFTCIKREFSPENNKSASEERFQENMVKTVCLVWEKVKFLGCFRDFSVKVSTESSRHTGTNLPQNNANFSGKMSISRAILGKDVQITHRICKV